MTRKPIKGLVGRREYLAKVAAANMHIGMGGFIALFCTALFLVVFVMSFSAINVGASLASSALIGLFALLGVRHCRSHSKKLKQLSYVPAVRQQIAELGAAEVLLRGSEPPAALPSELLRAAQKGPATASIELLRPEPAKKQK